MEYSDPRARRNDWWRPAPYQPQMRVSDAERHEIADILSKHFADGRLDDVEFNERLDKAMRAKTRGDLAGLLSDLPRPDAPPPPPPTRIDHDYHRWWRVGVLVAAVVVIANLASYSFRPHFPWVFVVVLVVLAVARRRRGWRRHVGSSGT